MIKINNLHKKYPNGVIALDGLSLEIKHGEFVFIIGPSGAGKSTFIKTLYCEEKVDSGQIIVDNTNVTNLKPKKVPFYRRQIGIVFQDFKLLKDQTVFQNVAFALEVTGVHRRDVRKKTMKALEIVGLRHKAKMYPDELSGGEQQRVAIARGIVREPKLLICDEPTGNLDPIISEEIMNTLTEVNKQGMTIIMATHDTRTVNKYGHRVVSIVSGQVMEDRKDGGYVLDESKY